MMMLKTGKEQQQEGVDNSKYDHNKQAAGLAKKNEKQLIANDRIKNFMWDKFNIDDIRELELKPVDDESDDDDVLDDASKSQIKPKKIDELYDIIKVVGAGGFGIVIACRDRISNKKFALKIAARYHAHAASSLRLERAMLSQMSHPNIIKVFDLKRDYKNLVIMKMELGKETISSYIDRHERKTGQLGIPEEQCAKMMKGLFSALAYLHDEQNVIHRDIKPDNIIIGSHKDLTRVKLVDFGLAVQDSFDQITDFAKCGTFLYKPPEQVTNIFAYAKKADVWASGIIMFQMLTGRHPILKEGMNKLQFEQAMKNFREIQLPKGMSPQAKHLISCLCQKNQSARYRAANALQHPFITRKLEQELPLSDLDRRALAIQNQPIEEKLRKAMRVLMVCAISKRQQPLTKKDLVSKHQEKENKASLASNTQADTTNHLSSAKQYSCCVQPSAVQQPQDSLTAPKVAQNQNCLQSCSSQKQVGGGAGSVGPTSTQVESSLTTQQSSGSSARNKNAQQPTDKSYQLESYKQMILTTKQSSPSATKDQPDAPLAQQKVQEAAPEPICSESIKERTERIIRNNSVSTINNKVSRTVKATRDTTPVHSKRVNDASKLGQQLAPVSSKQMQILAPPEDDQETKSSTNINRRKKTLVTASTEDRLHLTQTKLKAGRLLKKVKPSSKQKQLQHIIRLPAKLSLGSQVLPRHPNQQLKSNRSKRQDSSSSSTSYTKFTKLGDDDDQNNQCSGAQKQVKSQRNDNDDDQAGRKNANHTQFATRLPTQLQSNARRQDPEGVDSHARALRRSKKQRSASSHKSHKLPNQTKDKMSLQMSPSNKNDSNLSKQSFYSSRNFEQFSDGEEHFAADRDVKRKSQLSDNIPALQMLQMSRNAKKQITCAANCCSESQTILLGAQQKTQEEITMQSRKRQSRREFKTQRNHSSVESKSNDRMMGNGLLSSRQDLVCETEQRSRFMVKQKRNDLSSASSQLNNLVGKTRGLVLKPQDLMDEPQQDQQPNACMMSPPTIISNTAPPNIRKQQKSVRQASLKKHQLILDSRTKPVPTKLPGISTKQQSINTTQIYTNENQMSKGTSINALQPAKKSVLMDDNSRDRRQQHQLLNGFALNDPVQAIMKGLTPKRQPDSKPGNLLRQQQQNLAHMGNNLTQLEYETHSSTSQFSPPGKAARGLFNQQSLKKQTKNSQLLDHLSQKSAKHHGKSHHVRSMQAAGTAIVQGSVIQPFAWDNSKPAGINNVSTNDAKSQEQGIGCKRAQLIKHSRGVSQKSNSKNMKMLSGKEMLIKNLSAIPSKIHAMQDGTSSVLHGLLTSKQVTLSNAAIGTKSNDDQKENANVEPENDFEEDALMFQRDEDDDEEDEDDKSQNAGKRQKNNQRGYFPLQSEPKLSHLKRLRKTQHGSSESDIAALVKNHYQRSSISKLDRKKRKRHKQQLGTDGANVDPDDLDLMEFELPAPSSYEKLHDAGLQNNLMGSALRVKAAQSRYLYQVSANSSTLKHQTQSAGSHKQSGSALSKNTSNKNSQKPPFNKAQSDVLSAFSVQSFALK